jgi:hypothetical protein
MTRIVARILMNTGYRFPKYGTFGRGTYSRKALRLIGIDAVVCNIAADNLYISLER